MTPETIGRETTILVALLTLIRPDLAAAFDRAELRSAAAEIVLSRPKREEEER